MRINIVFHAKKGIIIPYNHSYELCSLIYRLMSRSNPQYTTFVHNYGYPYREIKKEVDREKEVIKNYKMFTFSRLRAAKYERTNKGIRTLSNTIFLEFSSPVPENISNLIIGLMEGDINLYFKNNYKIELKFKSIENLNIEIKPKMYFKCLSPLYVDTIIEDPITGKIIKNHVPSYPEEKEKIVEILKQNLIRKYTALHHERIEPRNFYFEFDKEYIEKHRTITSLQRIYKKGIKREINIYCYNVPFYIETNPSLIELGYYAGFGGKNSLGFGCVAPLYK